MDSGVYLCRELSGFDDVSLRFAVSALEQLAKKYGEKAVSDLLSTYSTDGIDQLNIMTKGPARDLLTYLYVGSFDSATYVIPEDYFDSLIWRAALAHPKGLSGGYFGHWRYPPEDSHVV